MDKSYQDLFFGQSQEYLGEISTALVTLEKDPQDTEAINVIFRLMHTLKGMSATMGYTDLAEFSHCFEDVFDSFRSGTAELTSERLDVIFECIDVFTSLMEDLKKDRSSSLDVTLYIKKLNQLIPQEEKTARKLFRPEELPRLDVGYLNNLKKQNKNIFRIEIHLNKDCQMKGTRALLVLIQAKTLGEIVRISPPQKALEEEEFEFSFEFVLVALKSKEEVKNELEKISDVEKINISSFDITYLERLKEKEGAYPVSLRKIHSVRIPAERLDKIINLMGELTIAKSRLSQTVQAKDFAALKEISYLIERLVASLQEEALKTRLLPVSYIFDTFPRIVRDLARKANKEVDLEITGGDIELDRVILDGIGDPLIHLIRNSIDHGIELSEERIKLGKNRRGTVSIKVYRDKGHIIIEICDDGKGIDFNKIIKKIAESGMASHKETSGFDQNKILDILTSPGFSTKEKVSEISGRGVGLDVVRNKIDALGGKLELDSREGKGAKFVLTLPLTLAIIKAMLITVGEQIYAIPFLNIRETLKIKPKEMKLIKDKEVIRLRDEIIPVIKLEKELSIRSSRSKNQELSIVVTEGRTRSLGFLVDSILGDQDIVVKPLGSFVKRVRGITGATILNDGRVALILDVITFQ